MVDRDEVRKIAKLAMLYISDEEIDGYTKDMQNIIAFADTINERSASDTGFDNINGLVNVFREDVIIPSTPQQEILKNAGGGEDGYFYIKRRQGK